MNFHGVRKILTLFCIDETIQNNIMKMERRCMDNVLYKYIMRRTYLLLVLLLQFTLLSADTKGQPVDCKYEWTQWTRCDPGPCRLPRNKQTRLAEIIAAPQDGGEPCPFNVGTSLGKYSVSSHDLPGATPGIIEYKLCDPTEPCYETNYCMSGQKKCNRPEKCIDESLNCDGFYECKNISEASEIHNLNNLEKGIHRIDSTIDRQKVLDDNYLGSCKTVYVGGVTYKKPYNFDTYDQIPIHENSWTSQKNVKISTWITKFGLSIKAVTKSVTISAATHNKIYSSKSKQAAFFHGHTTHVVDNVQHRVPGQLEVSASFEGEVKRLPLSIDYEQYFRFLSKFGTDYIQSAVRGGEINIVREMVKCVDIKRTESESAVDVPSVYVGASVGASNTEVSTSEIRTFDMKIKGGNISILSNITSETISSWLKTLNTRQVPLYKDIDKHKFTSYPIYDLLDSVYLKIKSKTLIKDNLRDALDLYIRAFDANRVCQPCSNDQTLVIQLDSDTGDGDYMCVCLEEKPLLTCGAEGVKTGALKYIVLKIIILLILNCGV